MFLQQIVFIYLRHVTKIKQDKRSYKTSYKVELYGTKYLKTYCHLYSTGIWVIRFSFMNMNGMFYANSTVM